jgi:hypothetical protein
MLTTSAPNRNGVNDTAHRDDATPTFASEHESALKLTGTSAVNFTDPVGGDLDPASVSLTVAVHLDRSPATTAFGEQRTTVEDEPAAIATTPWLPLLPPSDPLPP